jgi:type IV pilus assembly protein PilF
LRRWPRLLWGWALCASLAACSTQPPRPSATESPGEPLVKLGVAYMQRGDKALALEKLQRGLDLDPNLPAGHYAIALLYEQLGESDKAETHYHRAISLRPDYAEAHNAYGAFLCKRKDFGKADKEFLAAAENPLYSTRDLAYANAGLCALDKPDAALAEKYFRLALDLNPAQPTALFHMAALSYGAGHFLNARGYLQRYQEVGPQTPETLWLGVRTERRLGDARAAADYGLLLRQRFPDSKQAEQLYTLEKGGKSSDRDPRGDPGASDIGGRQSGASPEGGP